KARGCASGAGRSPVVNSECRWSDCSFSLSICGPGICCIRKVQYSEGGGILVLPLPTQTVLRASPEDIADFIVERSISEVWPTPQRPPFVLEGEPDAPCHRAAPARVASNQDYSSGK